MTRFGYLVQKFNLLEFLKNLKITFICFFILRLGLILGVGTKPFFTLLTFGERMLSYVILFFLALIIVSRNRNLVLLLINFLITLLLGLIGPLIKLPLFGKFISALTLYPMIFVFWFTRMHPVLFFIVSFFLIGLDINFIWLIFTIIFLIYVYEIVLNPFYPLTDTVFGAMGFYEQEIGSTIEKLKNSCQPRPFMFGISYATILEIYQNITLSNVHDSIVTLQRKSFIIVALNAILKLTGSKVKLSEHVEVHFVNFYYHREFLLLYILLARIYYFEQLFQLRN